MNCEHVQHWIMMISDDLSEAKRDLPGRTGEPAAFLRARIAEDEAILGWLQRSPHAVGRANDAPPVGYSIAEPAHAA
jgi:hypothetical protein